MTRTTPFSKAAIRNAVLAAALPLASVAAVGCSQVADSQGSTPKLFGPPVPHTEITTEVNPLDDSTRYLLVINSENSVPNSIGIKEHASLIVRCHTNGERDVYITTPTYNGGGIFSSTSTVSVRWNSDAVSTQTWQDASSGDAFFSRAPMTLLNRAAATDSLTFGWSPYNKTETAAKFNLKAHRNDLNSMKQFCQA